MIAAAAAGNRPTLQRDWGVPSRLPGAAARKSSLLVRGSSRPEVSMSPVATALAQRAASRHAKVETRADGHTDS